MVTMLANLEAECIATAFGIWDMCIKEHVLNQLINLTKNAGALPEDLVVFEAVRRRRLFSRYV
jgi:hypothetical protein